MLIKGGHLGSDATDIFYDGKTFYKFTSDRLCVKNSHGTGCTLSSAIASYMAMGYSPDAAIKNAKDYLYHAMKNQINVGHGNGPLNHLWSIKK